MRGPHPKDLFADRYRLHKRLAEDGLSESWLSHNEIIGSEQVVKIYNPLDEPGTRIFRRDFARAYHLMHPRLLQVIYFDVHEDRPYLVLPYIRRGSTKRLAGKLGEGEIARAMRDVSAALAYIHQPAYHIVHHDIRPDNILLNDQGHYLLSIYGISPELRRAYVDDTSEDETAAAAEVRAYLPAYQAPECSGENGIEKGGAAADIWGLGATLFELAAGHPPFGEEGGERQRYGQPAPDLPPSFSPELSNILKHCLDESPGGRPSADSLRQMAEAYLNNGQWPAQYQGGEGQAWRSEGSYRFWPPNGKRITLAAAVLAFFVAAAALFLYWPDGNGGNNLASDQKGLPEANLSEPATQKLPVKDTGVEAVELEKGATASPGLEIAEENEPALFQPEDSRPAPLAVQKKQEARAQPEHQPLERPAADRSAQTKQLPAPAGKPEQRAPKQLPAPSGQEAGAKGQTLQPQFNNATGKWGYVDKSGTWIIWPQFEKAGPFEGGKAKVALKDKNNGELKSYLLHPNGELTRLSEADVVDNQN